MKVLIVCCDYSLSGGSEKVAFKLYNELKNKIDVRLISLFCEKGKGSFDDSEVEYLIKRKVSFKTDIIPTIYKLTRLIKLDKPDIVLSVGVNASFYVCISGKISKVKTIVCEHSNLSNELYNDFFQNFRRNFAVRYSEKFITLTKEDLDNYRKKYPKNSFKFDSIYNWIDIELNSNIYKYDINSKRIITISRIDRVKGFEFSLKIFEKISKRFPDWRWEVYGDGDKQYLNELNDYIKLNGIEGFSFMGFCNDTESIYNSSALYCCNSLYEGLPLSLLEAKTHKIPIVSFDCKTGPKEIVEDNINGFLIEVGDVDTFVNKLSILISDSELRMNMSKNAYNNIEKFDKALIINKWIKTFYDL